MSSSVLNQPFTLPCGAVLPNRLCKAAMTEGLADPELRPTDRHIRLYKQWAEGGSGLLITGNVMIDRRVLERPGNVSLDPTCHTDEKRFEMLKRWAAAGTSNGNHLWMQISHAGRQSPRYVTNKPMAPSAVQLDLMGNYAKPIILTEADILDFIQRWATVAKTAKDAGFTGVQVHGAHGYLISSFLSPVTNQRTDQWGGPLENRARILLEAVRAVRKAVGDDFPVSVKLNSDDFRKGGFSNEDCIQVVKWLNDEKIDLLEISGGTYEQPKLLGFEGRSEDASAPKRESTVKREAYFLDYAREIRAVATMPIMVTGGFRSKEFMEQVISDKECDVIGLGRPLCTDADAPARLMNGDIKEMPSYEHQLKLADSGVFSPTSNLLIFKLVNMLGSQGWYYAQIFRLADGKKADPKRGIIFSLFAYLFDEYKTAYRMHKAKRKG